MHLRDFRRRITGMSGHEAARWLGVAPAMYWRWEQGQVPSPSNMRAIYRFSSGAVTPNCLVGMGAPGDHPLVSGECEGAA